MADNSLKTGLFTGDGNTYSIFRPAIGKPLPALTYVLRFSEFTGFYLDRQENMAVPARIYGPSHAERMVASFQDRALQGDSTGVWLNGEKGEGKTMLAGVLSKLLREKLELPTILIQSQFHGPAFNAFLSHIKSAFVLFDEYEKMYSDESAQNALLSVFSGAIQAQHLYCITTNAAYEVRDAMKNRPSRMRYFVEYRGISEAIAKEYVNEKMKDIERRPIMVKALSQIYNCNFDIMKSAVEEHNRFGGDVEEILAIMNIARQEKPQYSVLFEGEARLNQNEKFLPFQGTGHVSFDVEMQLERDGAISFYVEGKDAQRFAVRVEKQAVIYNPNGSLKLEVNHQNMRGTVTFVQKYASSFSTYRQGF